MSNLKVQELLQKPGNQRLQNHNLQRKMDMIQMMVLLSMISFQKTYQLRWMSICRLWGNKWNKILLKTILKTWLTSKRNSKSKSLQKNSATSLHSTWLKSKIWTINLGTERLLTSRDKICIRPKVMSHKNRCSRTPHLFKQDTPRSISRNTKTKIGTTRESGENEMI